MGARQLWIDGDLAENAEAMAEALGYQDLDYYVMDLLERDLEQWGRIKMATEYWLRNTPDLEDKSEDP